MDLEILAIKIGTVLKESKAENIVILNVETKTKMVKYLVLASVKTNESAKEMQKMLEEYCLTNEIKVFSVDGINKGDWIATDLGEIIVHILTKTMREKYNLEKLWKDPKSKEIKL